MQKFADDTKLGQVIMSPDDSRRLQDCLNMLMDWAQKWGMTFNTSNPRISIPCMGGTVLDTTVTERDLGVLVSK